MSEPLVSIIMAAYNAEAYIAEAIQSVLDQDHANFELIIVNDGSSDSTEQVILSFIDQRIRYFSQVNKGVSEARNKGLSIRKGTHVCFLDADDRMPKNSLSDRLQLFDKNSSIRFVDGFVEKWNADFTELKFIWKPNFEGAPLSDLIHLKGQSFFGPTWMIKLDPDELLQFKVGLSHGEDLLLYMELARRFPDAIYSYTNMVVLQYRVHNNSAMRNLNGLDIGYRTIESIIAQWPDIPESWRKAFHLKTRRIMIKSYLRNFQLLEAFKSIT